MQDVLQLAGVELGLVAEPAVDSQPEVASRSPTLMTPCAESSS